MGFQKSKKVKDLAEVIMLELATARGKIDFKSLVKSLEESGFVHRAKLIIPTKDCLTFANPVKMHRCQKSNIS